MGYQALLFCPDEKLARVVSQVFGEVEFAVDLVSEPFAAVKKLMAQRFDAIVVDCNDEQNTSLLFKSARNSSFNQSSLAIALVEGQAGVAKAYRIGANLVLTKPINVEQSKGTLRVARGLLRKNSDAANATIQAAPATSSTPAPTPAPAPAGFVEPPSQPAAAAASAPSYDETPVFEASLPVMAASAHTEEKPAAVPAPPAEQPKTGFVKHVETQGGLFGPKLIGLESPKETPKAAVALLKAASPSAGGAAAPAPAKDARKENEAASWKEPRHSESGSAQPQIDHAYSKVSPADVPTFAGLEDENAGTSGRSKKFFMIAVAALVLVAAGYYGWTKFGAVHTNNAPQPAMPRTQEKPPTAQTTPAVSGPAPAASPSSSTNDRTGNDRTGNDRTAATTPSSSTVSKPSATKSDQPFADDSQAARIALSPQTEAKKPTEAAIHVKSSAKSKGGQPQTEESPSQLPSPLAVASQGGPDLTGVVAPPTSGAKPVLTRVKLSQGVSQGLLIKRVQPKYPAAALSSHTQGAVEIEATIDREGKVVNPKVLSGDRILAAAAVEAVRQWRYKPYYLDGQPTEVQTQITIKFKVD